MKEIIDKILIFGQNQPLLIKELEILVRQLQIETLNNTPDHQAEYYKWGRISKLERQIQELQR